MLPPKDAVVRTKVHVDDPVCAGEVQTDATALETHKHDGGLILGHESPDGLVSHCTTHVTLISDVQRQLVFSCEANSGKLT